MITEDVNTFCQGYHSHDANVIIQEFTFEISKINKSMKEHIKSNTTAIIPFTHIPSTNKIDICTNGMSTFISKVNVDTITNIIDRSYLNNKDINFLVSIPVISYLLKIINDIISNLSSILLLLDDKFEMIEMVFAAHNISTHTISTRTISTLNLLIDKITHANNQYLLLNIFLQIYQRFDYIYFRLIYETSNKYCIRSYISDLIDYGEIALVDYEDIINKYTTKYDDNIRLLDSISMLIQNSKIMLIRENKNNNKTAINNLNNKIEGLELCLLISSKNKDDILDDINNLKNINLLSTTICEHVKRIARLGKKKHDPDSDSDPNYNSNSDSDY